MAADDESRPDAVTELIRALREQVASHVNHIENLERRLVTANERIAAQQRLLARLLEKGAGAEPPIALPPDLARPIERLQKPVPLPAPPARRRSQSRAAPRGAAVAVAPPSPKPDSPAPTPAALAPAPRVQLPAMESSMPRLESIAESVLNARGTAVDPDRRAGSTDIRAHTPTAGTVRAAAVAPSSTGDARETTLTLDREELARAHRAEASRRRWFPFGRR